MRYIKSFDNDAAIQAAIDNKSLGKPYIALDDATGKIDWNEKDINYAGMYMTIEVLESGNFYVRSSGVGYSVNGGEWETTTGATTLALTTGDAVRFKRTKGDGGYHTFTGNTISFKLYGNSMSLIYGDDFENKTSLSSQYAFEKCFEKSSGLRDASNLIIPILSLSKYCFAGTFNGCTSLATAPALPATTLAEGCYGNMFIGCTSLNYIKCLATNPKGSGIGSNTRNWVSDIAASGTFVKKAGVTWSTGSDGIPKNWTVIEE